MDEILTRLTTSITKFKANPNKEVAAAENQPFCVLTNNSPAFYVLSPSAWEAIQERLWDLEQLPDLQKASKEGTFYEVSTEDLLSGNFPEDLED